MAQESEPHGDTGPVRVMHITDTLGGGGVERLIWDIVRLSDPLRVRYRVVAFFPDGYFGPFVYADRLRQLGAYGCAPDEVKGKGVAAGRSESVTTVVGEQAATIKSGTKVSRRTIRAWWRDRRQALGERIGKLSPGFHRLLKIVYSAVASAWHRIRYDIPGKIVLHVSASARILREYFHFRPDVIHVHGFYPFIYGIFFKSIFRRPVVHTVPAMFAQMVDQGTGWLPGQYRRFHRRVDRFFLGTAYRAELLEVGVPEEKLSDIYGTVDVQEIIKTKSMSDLHRLEIRAKLGISEDSLIALSVGRLDPSKGHQYALEALPRVLEHFPNLHWVVLGEGWKRAALEARLKELGIEQYAHLLGFVDDPLPFYAAADIYLRTMVFEGDNISSLNAIGMGLPVVGFNTGNALDFIPKIGHGISVPNQDVEALAAAIRQVLALPDRGGAMGRLGIDYSHTHLDIKQGIDNFVSSYLDLHQKGKKGALLPTTPGDNDLS